MNVKFLKKITITKDSRANQHLSCKIKYFYSFFFMYKDLSMIDYIIVFQFDITIFFENIELALENVCFLKLTITQIDFFVTLLHISFSFSVFYFLHYDSKNNMQNLCFLKCMKYIKFLKYKRHQFVKKYREMSHYLFVHLIKNN